MLLVVCLMLASGLSHSGQKVWIDSDPACGGSKTDDVDDCWALTQAIAADEIDVIAISTVFGNGDGEQSYQSARALIESFGMTDQIPVYRGANGPIRSQDKDANEVTQALANALNVEPLTIVALGPLTNIAQLIADRPDLIGNIKEILVVAGKRPQNGFGFYPGLSRIFHLHDLNFRKDVDAFEAVLNSSAQIVFIPYEVAKKISIQAKDLAYLATGGPASQWIAEISKPWLDFWQTSLKADGFFPFDSLAIGRLISPSYFTCENIPVKIERHNSRFTSSRDDLLVSHDFKDNPYVEYCYGVDIFLKRIF